ncbi:hypothetical protein [Kutzneria buriramensis]|uniref:Uncharacterized protein n=1 Tax=Kutzneria buriramensis TaxID=1045776 RepID=A0A3E0HCD4_9PSEU|nr:hypothetical protein [Kutzneria buriramensis]REH42510.1 hypothetical protein BCF44_1104 [Kutzneria buriramensis]
MRLVRLGDAQSAVAADVKSALASWGGGDAVLGGVALAGYLPPGRPRPVDMLVLLPNAVVVIAGVDLPDPAMKLDAPLAGQWKIDGWPLVGPDPNANPAAEALGVAEAVAEVVRDTGLPVRLVLAVGPYVGQVTQPQLDLDRGIRVLHPMPTTLLAAVRDVAGDPPACTAEQAGGLLIHLCPDERFTTDELLAEGFPAAQAAAPPAPAKKRRRWLPIGAAALLGALAVGSVIAALTTGGPSPAAADAAYTRVADVHDGANCAEHAYGDVQVWLSQHPCTDLRRWNYRSGDAGVAIAEVRFAAQEAAVEFQAAAAKPGGGGVNELVRERPWPGGPVSFDNAAFDSNRSGGTVRLVETVWIGRPSTADDPALVALAKRMLKLALS